MSYDGLSVLPAHVGFGSFTAENDGADASLELFGPEYGSKLNSILELFIGHTPECHMVHYCCVAQSRRIHSISFVKLCLFAL